MAKKSGEVSGTASLLVTEGLIATLRRRGLLTGADVARVFSAARAEAEKLPATHIRVEKVGTLIDAMAIRARRAAPARKKNGAGPD